ncbi:3-hydroxyacyl-CoA dehydrogenase [Salipiger pallidus]|uniref:3-hydroxyacyl-CoA dehydrogenase n=1 Tax=Salipiger pallidus TaxID=1775170 RepID=A0A8J2ZKK5_9RHOB|nr:SDR family NAD(P)-dependent oxidoreductase [Salipiger pallidus]GGG74771.1 3-hydroxyacyl-CoA dehydrogenase [Salipiger pallidus]
MQIEGASYLVTGAGSGLGSAVAEMIASAGGRPVLLDVNAEAGTARAEELGKNARFIHCDVTSADSAEAAVAEAVRSCGPISGLVNCAGIAPGEKIVGKDGPHGFDSFARAISINLVGTFNMLRLAAQAMSSQETETEGERGVIINTASIAAYDGQIGQAAYAASKGGVASLTLPAARELARHGIRVVTIAPGLFATPMMLGLPQAVQDSLGGTIPYPPRLGHPEEYASMVREIIGNRMLNGEVIRLDGALRMAPR